MRGLIVCCCICLSNLLFSQIDHWETVVDQGNEWEYLLPQVQLASNWTALGFDASDWDTGNSGFGYGDDDDATIVANTASIFLRKTFMIFDPGAIESAIFHMDYDDGFVAYLNGVEIGRSLMDGANPAFNQFSSGFHEAALFNGGTPSGFPFDASLLNQGQNILAVQVHNENINSSDLTAIPFLSVGINNNSSLYGPTPNWFNPPVSYASSNLPVVNVNTLGQVINSDDKINARFGIIYNGPNQNNNFDDVPNEYEGFCGIKIRGESSQTFAKKSYAIEMWDDNQNDIDTSFLNFPSEEDFILYGPYSDKTLLNNVLAMNIGNAMGRYASRTRLVELAINDDYQGVYVLMEKIKRDNDRVAIAKLEETEIEGDDLTGGYIFRIDKGIYDGWYSKYNALSSPEKIYFQYFYPNQEKIQDAQKDYIQNYVDGFEAAIAAPNAINSEGKHYTEYINLRSFVDNFILNELSKNVDAYRLSTYFHKDKDSKGGKIIAGPFWDFNLAFGNGDYCSGDDVTGWEYYQCPGFSPFWWDRFMDDPTFTEALSCRWEYLRGNLLSTNNLENYIDSLANVLSEPQERNFQKWQILGQYIWPNPPYFSQAQTHDEVITAMKSWISQRLEWLDTNIPGVAQNCEQYDEDFELNTATTDLNNSYPAFHIYPNPSRNGFNIQGATIIESVQILNTLGQMVHQGDVNDYSFHLPFPRKMTTGIYYVQINTKEGKSTQRILIEY